MKSEPNLPGRDQNQPPSVALVSMPFHRCTLPPIGLSLLKAALATDGLHARVYNFNLDLLPELGDTAERALERYELIGDHLSNELGSEWFFAPPDDERDAQYLGLLPDRNFEPGFRSLLCELRSRVDDFILRSAERIVSQGHDIVGFSSSFARTRANVRLAEAIKRLAPATRILTGGYEASGDMGCALLEAFPVFDLVCHSEADDLIVPLVRALRGEPGYSLEALGGISFRRGDRVVSQIEAASLPDIELVPVPDYTDFFEDVARLAATWDPRFDQPRWLPVETARGCWWGAHAHCKFCSYNADRIAWRSKSPERVESDLAILSARHERKRFLVVDNILGNDSYRTLLPRLGELQKGYMFHWEMRSTVSREQAAILARAGVFHAFLGVESLSTPVLSLLNKRTRAIDNIQALKWLQAFDVGYSWHFLFSAPGEQLEWYEQVGRQIPRLMHLKPPLGPLAIVVQRFSPYFAAASEQKIKLLGPTVFARLVFADISQELLGRLVCDFDHEFVDRPSDLDSRIAGILKPLLDQWRERFDENGCTLSLIDGPDESLLVEGPLLRPERMLRVRGLLRAFLKGCESIQPERRLLEQLATNQRVTDNSENQLDSRAYRELVEELSFTGVQPEHAPAVTLSDVLDFADEQGWIYRESGRILSLPVNETRFVKSDPFQLEAVYRRYLSIE